jgi:hypothetical protein
LMQNSFPSSRDVTSIGPSTVLAVHAPTIGYFLDPDSFVARALGSRLSLWWHIAFVRPDPSMMSARSSGSAMRVLLLYPA